ncbi:aminotransferase class V-fold PLP-dependent enzyme [Streptomyces sp. SD15]
MGGAVGQLPLDAARIGCHLLTGDGWRFLCGPYSVGCASLAPRLRGALEAATPHCPPPETAAVAGLNAALGHRTATATAGEGLGLLPALRAAFEETPGTELIAPGPIQSAIFAFRHHELPAALIRRQLAARGVIVWKTVAEETPLHLPPRGTGGGTALRASLHHDSTAHDIAAFGQALKDVVREQQPHSARAHPAAPARSQAAPTAADPPRLRAPARRRHLTVCQLP